MVTGWNPSQATFYLELSSDDWLVVYKDPCSTELIKPTSIAFQSQQRTSGCNRPKPNPLVFWATQHPIWCFGQLCSVVHAVLGRGCQPLVLSYLKPAIKNENHFRTAVQKISLLSVPQPHLKPEKLLFSQDCCRVQCFQCTELPESIYTLKRKYSLYLPNRCDYLLRLTTEET